METLLAFDRQPLNDRQILRALKSAAIPDEAPPGGDPLWQSVRFDAEKLKEAFTELAPDLPKAQVEAFAEQFSHKYRLRKARTDDLTLPLPHHIKLSRAILGDALGSLGARLFPTRQSALGWATDAARELIFFGNGVQTLESPFAICRSALRPNAQSAKHAESDARPQKERPVLIEQGPGDAAYSWTASDLLERDPCFLRHAKPQSALQKFRHHLREDPLDGAMIELLRPFFNERVTVGIRDAARWILGSRHPWFDWSRARSLLEESFSAARDTNFYTPRIHLYLYDLSIDDAQLELTLKRNRECAEELARQLKSYLPDVPENTVESRAQMLERCLDYYFDYPDYDGEKLSLHGAATLSKFARRALNGLGNRITGWSRALQFNSNFESLEFDQGWFQQLPKAQKTAFFDALRRNLRAGAAQIYRRPPMAIYVFHESSEARPRADETLLDSFRLSEMRAPQHALAFQKYPKLAQTLAVFFTLALRHGLDTDHYPDLQPPYALRDFLLLGTWGYDTWNLRVNLYRNGADQVRIEVFHIGRLPQLARYKPGEMHFKAAIARQAAMAFGPLFEPSTLRALSVFLMAEEEQKKETHDPDGHFAWMKHGVEVFRKVGHQSIRGGLINLSTTCESLFDDGVDALETSLEKLESLFKR